MLFRSCMHARGRDNSKTSNRQFWSDSAPLAHKSAYIMYLYIYLFFVFIFQPVICSIGLPDVRDLHTYCMCSVCKAFQTSLWHESVNYELRFHHVDALQCRRLLDLMKILAVCEQDMEKLNCERWLETHWLVGAG